MRVCQALNKEELRDLERLKGHGIVHTPTRTHARPLCPFRSVKDGCHPSPFRVTFKYTSATIKCGTFSSLTVFFGRTELGAKADPGRFKRIFTDDKKRLLFEYKLRLDISAQISSTVKILEIAQKAHRYIIIVTTIWSA